MPVFKHGSAGQPDLVFSMSASANGSLALHLAGTSKHSWIAVGTGTEMQDSMMFIVYGEKTRHGATLSTRYSTGENEPKYMSNMNRRLDDYDAGGTVHAVVICLAFVIVFPLGALLLRFVSVRVHYTAQLAASILVIVGLGTGIYISMEYNRTKNYNTAHQIIRMIVFAGVAVQSILGTVHHVIYKRTHRSTKLGKIHRCLGPEVLVLGIINAPLGTVVGQRSQYNVPYAVLVAVLAVLFFAARFYIWRSTRKTR